MYTDTQPVVLIQVRPLRELIALSIEAADRLDLGFEPLSKALIGAAATVASEIVLIDDLEV